MGREGTDPPEAVLCTAQGVGGNIESKRSASPCHHRRSLHFPRKTNCLTDASISELKYKTGRVILKSLRQCRQLERQLRDDASNLDRMPLNCCWGFARFGRGPPVVGAILRAERIRRVLGHRPHPNVVPHNFSSCSSKPLSNVYYPAGNMLSTYLNYLTKFSQSPYKLYGKHCS